MIIKLEVCLVPSESLVTFVEAVCSDGTDNCTIRVTFNSSVNDFAHSTFLNISVCSFSDKKKHILINCNFVKNYKFKISKKMRKL